MCRLALIATYACFTVAQTIRQGTVQLDYARIQGYVDNAAGYTRFIGVRYAVPPTGPNRWRPPQPIQTSKWYPSGNELVPNAGHDAPNCVQGHPAWSGSNPGSPFAPDGREDCLTLDIIVPHAGGPGSVPAGFDAPSFPAPLPVLVRIHGGGYTLGGAETYQGLPMLRGAAAPYISVTVQYRLGAYGFLGGNEVGRDGGLNLGLRDQRVALQWVKRYISQFGGDPGRVTIMGGSAGGGSVTAQMQMFGGDDAAPPFQAAVAEFPWWQPFHDPNIQERQYRNLLQAAGCSDLACLRRMSEQDLKVATQWSYNLGYSGQSPDYGYGDFYYGPVVDGTFIRGLPTEEFQNGRFTKVPIMTNRETNEGIFFSNNSLRNVAEEQRDIKQLFPSVNAYFFNRLQQLYPQQSYGSIFDHRAAIFGDALINCPTHRILSAVNANGKPTWKMVFNGGGGGHGATGRYLFDEGYDSAPNANIPLARTMRRWYSAFVLGQSPNEPYGPSGFRWEVYDGLGRTLEVNEWGDQKGFDTRTITDPDIGTRCDFWRAQSPVVRNRMVSLLQSDAAEKELAASGAI